MIYFKMSDLDALALKPKQLEAMVRTELTRVLLEDANPFEKLVTDLLAAIRREHDHHLTNADLRPSYARRIGFDIQPPQKGKVGGVSYHQQVEV